MKSPSTYAPSDRLDAFDLKILRLLQNDGRLPIVELAEQVGLSPTPTLRRLRRLERDGVITGYGAKLDRQRAGLSLTVFLQLKIDGHHAHNAAQLHTHLLRMQEIRSCHIVSGDADLIAEVVVRDLAAYEVFLLKKLLELRMIKEVRSSISLRALKVDGALALAQS